MSDMSDSSDRCHTGQSDPPNHRLPSNASFHLNFTLDNLRGNHYISLMQSFIVETNSELETNDARLIVEAVPLVMRAINAEIRRRKPQDITLPQLRVLAYLQDHAGISLSELAEHLGFLPSSASKVVDQLVTRGLIMRQDDPSDRRRAVLTITPDGRIILCLSRKAILPFLGDRLATLSTGERATLTAAMGLLRKLFTPEKDAHAGQSADIEMK